MPQHVHVEPCGEDVDVFDGTQEQRRKMDHLRDRHGAALSVCRPFRPDSLANVSRGGALRARPWLPSGRAFGAILRSLPSDRAFGATCARYLLTAPSELPE